MILVCLCFFDSKATLEQVKAKNENMPEPDFLICLSFFHANISHLRTQVNKKLDVDYF